MMRIVVVGAGIAGVPTAYALKAGLGPNDDVTMVSDRDYFHFVPSNPWVALGWREHHEMAFPIAPYLTAQGIGFIPQAAQGIDPALGRVHLASGSAIDYDFLLLATGPEAAFDEVEGLVHTHSVIPIEQALQAQAAYREFIHRPGPVLIGAAPHASVLGPVYECAFLMDEDLRRRGIRHRVPITLLTPEPYVGHLGLGGEGDTPRLLENAMAECGIEHVTCARTLRVEANRVHFVQVDAEGKESEPRSLLFAFSLFWPAFRGVTALRSSAELTNARGFVAVDEYLRHPRYHNIFAVGLCAAREPVEHTPVPVGAPVSVYSIQNEVETAVGNLLASRYGEPLTSIVPKRAQWLNDMGENGAAYLSAPQVPLRNIHWLKQGRWVHEAKVAFEDHFINSIKLISRGTGDGVYSHLATAMADMQAEPTDGIARLSLRHQYCPKSLQLSVQRELYYELRAFAGVFGLEFEDLAARLLHAAARDAKSYLGKRLAEEVELTRRRILFGDLPENQPGVEFEGGSP
jgi:sulfide:quinone oxidoreductase